LKKVILLLIIIGASFTSCERDDICAETTPTTPRLIIRFFDNDMPENLQAVESLNAIALGDDNVPITISGFVTMSTDSLTLPLRTDADQTRFILTLNSNDDATSNIDTLTVNYEREDIFVSRACGFSTNFNNIMILVEPDADNWILDSVIIPGRENVTDETAAHVQIRH